MRNEKDHHCHSENHCLDILSFKFGDNFIFLDNFHWLCCVRGRERESWPVSRSVFNVWDNDNDQNGLTRLLNRANDSRPEVCLCCAIHCAKNFWLCMWILWGRSSRYKKSAILDLNLNSSSLTLIEASIFKLTVVFLVFVDSANVVMPDRAEVNVCRLKILEEFETEISKNIYFDKKSTKLDLLPTKSLWLNTG